MNIEIAQELINTRLKNNLGRYNSRSLNEKWFIKNDLKELYQFILEHTDIIKDRPIGERLWAIENYPIPYCECGKPAKRYDNARYWSKYCSKECSLSSPIRAQQISQTKLSIDHTISNNKRSNTMIEKYGVAYNSQRPELKEMLGEKSSKNQLHNEAREKLIDYDWVYKNYVLENKTMAELALKLKCDNTTIRSYILKHNLEIQQYHKISTIQKNVFNYITNELMLECVYDKMGLLNGKEEIDVFIPSLNIGIEVNGLYYHSWKAGNKEQNYHYNKYKTALDNNIRLYQFWEDDINYKFPIIKNIIANFCNLTDNKLDARKCSINDVNLNEAKDFYINNHIQGMTGNNIKSKGLIYDGNLIALMSYTLINDITTINRYCSLLTYNVRGGFSKLLKSIPGDVIKTYSSNDLSNGLLYKNNGFNIISEKSHNMFYTDYHTIYNREKFMKHRLSKVLKIYDESKSEIENMLVNGYDVIYKSGTKTWVLNR